MVKKAYNLFFKETLIKEPIMFIACRDHQVVLNVRRARITHEFGEATIELDGQEADIEAAVKQISEAGVQVESVLGDYLQQDL